MEKLSANFPGISFEDRIFFDEVIFNSPVNKLNIAILNVSNKPPNHAVKVDLALRENDLNNMTGVIALHWDERYGYALGIGHKVQSPKGSSKLQKDRNIFYTHMTGPSASGAPVFNASNGKLTCIHQAGFRVKINITALVY